MEKIKNNYFISIFILFFCYFLVREALYISNSQYIMLYIPGILSIQALSASIMFFYGISTIFNKLMTSLHSFFSFQILLFSLYFSLIFSLRFTEYFFGIKSYEVSLYLQQIFFNLFILLIIILGLLLFLLYKEVQISSLYFLPIFLIVLLLFFLGNIYYYSDENRIGNNIVFTDIDGNFLYSEGYLLNGESICSINFNYSYPYSIYELRLIDLKGNSKKIKNSGKPYNSFTFGDCHILKKDDFFYLEYSIKSEFFQKKKLIKVHTEEIPELIPKEVEVEVNSNKRRDFNLELDSESFTLNLVTLSDETFFIESIEVWIEDHRGNSLRDSLSQENLRKTYTVNTTFSRNKPYQSPSWTYYSPFNMPYNNINTKINYRLQNSKE